MPIITTIKGKINHATNWALGLFRTGENHKKTNSTEIPEEKITSEGQNESQIDKVKSLLDTISNKGNPSVTRTNSIMEINNFQDKRIVPLLIDLLKNKDEDYEVRRYCAYVMGLRTDPQEINIILEVMIPLLNDKKDNGHVRFRIAVALAHIGNARALEALKVLESDPNEEQIAGIKYAIEKIQTRLQTT